MKKRGALEFSFAWIFAIIAGAFILFLAIYGITKFTGTQQAAQTAETSKQIGVLLDPLETSFETGKSAVITTGAKTIIYNKCSNVGSFGTQSIQTAQEINGKFSDTSTSVGFKNKYIFSEKEVRGKKFYLFSKPFEFPFKIADLIIITSADKTYCFENAPRDIENEIGQLNQSNFKTLNCASKDIRICFDSSENCDINVNTHTKSVEKNNQISYYEGDALMYSAIFSDNEIYNCQIQRLMKRTYELSAIYAEKERTLSQTAQCGLELNSYLNTYENLAKNLENSEDLYVMANIGGTLSTLNDNKNRCALW